MIRDQKLELAELPEGKLVVAAGNSSAMWSRLQEYQRETGSENPVDDYAREAAGRISQHMAEARGSKIIIRRTKDLEPDKLVSFTRLIQALPRGFGSRCYFHGQAGFLFHQKFGNWHAWRFALIFEDIDFEPSPDAY
jgi:hypothetical protein